MLESHSMPIHLQGEYLPQRAIPTLHFNHAENCAEQQRIKCSICFNAFACSASASWKSTAFPAYGCFLAYMKKKKRTKNPQTNKCIKWKWKEKLATVTFFIAFSHNPANTLLKMVKSLMSKYNIILFHKILYFPSMCHFIWLGQNYSTQWRQL